MSVQIDPVHVPLQFLSVQQMQDVRAQETVAPESSLPNETLKLSDYKMSQVPDAPRVENSEIQERENQQVRRKHSSKLIRRWILKESTLLM